MATIASPSVWSRAQRSFVGRRHVRLETLVVLLAVGFVLYVNADDEGSANSAFVYDMN